MISDTVTMNAGQALVLKRQQGLISFSVFHPTIFSHTRSQALSEKSKREAVVKNGQSQCFAVGWPASEDNTKSLHQLHFGKPMFRFGHMASMKSGNVALKAFWI